MGVQAHPRGRHYEVKRNGRNGVRLFEAPDPAMTIKPVRGGVAMRGLDAPSAPATRPL